jgi:hypothetical protein
VQRQENRREGTGEWEARGRGMMLKSEYQDKLAINPAGKLASECSKHIITVLTEA